MRFPLDVPRLSFDVHYTLDSVFADVETAGFNVFFVLAATTVLHDIQCRRAHVHGFAKLGADLEL
jgi:hypothetical protein